MKSKKTVPGFSKAKDLCRKLVVEIRDRHTCQRCGRTQGKIEWSHVITRNAPSLYCVPWNSLALCGPKLYSWTCHYWWHANSKESLAWWEEKFPERALLLQAWRHARPRRTPDRRLEAQWLDQEIQRLTATPT